MAPPGAYHSILVQLFGPSPELQVQFCDQRGWGVSDQCPRANIYGFHAGSELSEWTAPWLPVPVLGEYVGLDRPVKFDVYASTERVYVFVEDRPAEEPHHVGHAAGIAGRLERQLDALEQAGQLERVRNAHAIEHLVGGEILDPDDEVAAHRPELRRQPVELLGRERLEFGERGRLVVAPRERVAARSVAHRVSAPRRSQTGRSRAR